MMPIASVDHEQIMAGTRLAILAEEQIRVGFNLDDHHCVA